MDDELERELRALLDRDRVTALVHHYFATVDKGQGLDVEWARTVFSDDVRIEHRDIVLTGLDEVAFGHAFVRAGWSQTLHFATNLRVETDGDGAHVSGRLLAVHLHQGGDPPEPYVITNSFEAEAVRTADGWRLRSIAQHTIWSSGRSHLDLATDES